MACDITAGRKKPCKNSMGGLSKVYFINFVENAFTVVNGVATAINPLVTEVFEYEVTGDANNFNEALTPDRGAGTTVNTQTVTLALQKLTKEDNYQLNLLAYGYPIAVVKDRNNNYKIAGITEGVDFTVTATTGAAKADFNGYNLTGTAMEAELAPMLNEATMQALIDLVVEDTPSV